MNYKDTVDTGRTLLRSDRLCESCEMRLTLGEPKAADTWPARIHIDDRNMDLLLVAAAEYRDLCETVGYFPDAIDFLDWVRTDALAPVGEISPIKAVEPEPVSLAEKRWRHAAGAA